MRVWNFFCCGTSQLHLQLQLQSYTLQQLVFRGIMQCYRLVGKDGFSAWIGTVGDCCVVSWVQVEMLSGVEWGRTGVGLFNGLVLISFVSKQTVLPFSSSYTESADRLGMHDVCRINCSLLLTDAPETRFSLTAS